ncbi:MAG TPA: TonB-dependent receptor [Terriglobales bacterium]|nr:TonB-dependent receptor [Terriglobales bacterium]
MHRPWIILLLLPVTLRLLAAQDNGVYGRIAVPQGQRHASSEKDSQPLSGTIVDTSGAVIAGATVQVWGAGGAVQRTARSESDGSFIISGLPEGNYRLVVSNPGFETKEIPVVIGAGVLAPLRISLAVSALSTTINVQGRADDLVGIATSAGQVTVGAEELQNRPILRSGEILEALPGLIITQHAGGGKANQYFLRGFNLDHGTDFAIFLDGMPLNLPSHAHGEGYSDMNTVIPEFVQRIDAEKGPYYANVGDYGSAGNAQVVYYKTLPQNFLQVDGGMYQFARLVFGVSQKLGKGCLLYGGEAYHDGGPWVHPDNYYKFNGLVTYSQGTDANGFSITTRAYDGARWNSSDQLPYTAIPVVGFFGSLNPNDGGRSQRYSLQGEWHHKGESSETSLMAYGFYYDLNLFSDFTYYLVDPYKGDQFEQQDRRWVAGFDARHTISGHFFGRKTETTFGMQVRNGWIHNGLFRTEDRLRTDKTFYTANYLDVPSFLDQVAVLPAATDLNKFTETIVSPWVTTKVQWAEKFRSILAFRGDYGEGVITSFTNPINPNFPNYPGNFPANFNPNSGQSVSKFLPSPKASLTVGPWANSEFYVQGGFSYHTNDVRGSSQLYEPVSPDFPYYNTPTYNPTNPTKIPFLVATKGAEIGVRTAAIPQLQSTVEIWYLHSNSELLQDGDTGGTSPSQQSSNRYGIEVGNYYTPAEHLVFDADLADSRAIFTQDDADDSTFYTLTPTGPQLCARNSNCFGLIPTGGGTYLQNPYGKEVPEAVRWVVAAGATLQDYRRFSASLRLRYFGPRPLTSDGLYTSPSTALVNLEASYKFNKNWSLMGEVLNLLNRRDHDVDYAYVSQILPAAELGLPATPPTTLAGQELVANAVNANAAFTRVMHPVEPVQARFSLRYSFGR